MIKPKSRKHEDRIKALEESLLIVARTHCLRMDHIEERIKHQWVIDRIPAKKWWQFWR